MAKTLRVTLSAAGSSKTADVDNVDLHFSGDSATRQIEPGEHILSWVVEGRPGKEYSVAINAPRESQFGPKTYHIWKTGKGKGSKVFFVD